MKRLFRNLGATTGIVIFLVLIVILAKLISMIPIQTIIDFAYANWKGIIGGVILSHLGIGITELFHREQKEDE